MTTSLQLFSLYSAVQADGWDATIRAVADLGFTSVEPFAIHVLGDEIAPLLRDAGLTAPTAHGFLDADRVDATLAAAAALGVQTVYQPHFEPEEWKDLDAVTHAAATLIEASRRAESYGIRVGIHNHDVELLHRIGGVPAFDLLVGMLPEGIAVEYDIYWSTLAGLDPATEVARWGGRVGALHLKDAILGDPPRQVALGDGVIDIDAAIAAAPPGIPLVVSLDRLTGTATESFAAVHTSRQWLNRHSATTSSVSTTNDSTKEA
ncbi:MAG TPA: sugar phosphate isomerase/epimerase [Propionibacteriaceae bacterium]|nr:sugar phosphate isomerase/epimerase [Propionibacteriaceae bacterium]